ncbi:MAG TPA: 5-formyltetrahydrofolate cyclo-ligase [Longimicrobium sp.]|nr:5-formyltetrahydrofolate cyclo-ligase [Longimicrobium sp.]
MSKDALRAEARAFLRALPPAERAAAEARIARRVWEVPEIAGARTLLVYASLPEEVGTDGIAAEARRRGITLVYPRCLPEGRMTLHAVDAPDALRPGRFGIREPDADASPLREPGEIDAALIPGLAWDRAGHRLGRGAGYYDRLLAHPEWRGFRCGLFFAAQETPSIPHEAWDVRLDAIVTEQEIARTTPVRDSEDLAGLLQKTWSSDRPHNERMIWSAAIIATALHRAGMRATLVGGGAIEFHAPGVYTTTDLDFVIEGRPRAEIDPVMRSLGMQRQGRHWVMGDLYVEVPGNVMEEPVDTETIGPFELRVIRKEYVVADRIVGFRHWKSWAHGAQAITLIRTLGRELDDKVLRAALRKEGAEHAYGLLRRLAASDEEVTPQRLDALWHKHYR